MKITPPHSLMISCHADSLEALVGTVREALQDLEAAAESGDLDSAAVLQTGGAHSLIQLNYTHPSDLVFSAKIPD